MNNPRALACVVCNVARDALVPFVDCRPRTTWYRAGVKDGRRQPAVRLRRHIVNLRALIAPDFKAKNRLISHHIRSAVFYHSFSHVLLPLSPADAQPLPRGDCCQARLAPLCRNPQLTPETYINRFHVSTRQFYDRRTRRVERRIFHSNEL